MKNPLVSPVVKWMGGKRQLLENIIPLLPEKITSYCEPFVGGGALLFALQPKNARINDINKELITTYSVIRDDVDSLIDELRKYKNESSVFYEVRNLDRDKAKYSNLSDVEKSARFIFLNKTCYNGMYRVNKSGEFNVPFGRYKEPNIVNENVLRAVSAYFNDNRVVFSSKDYAEVVKGIPKGCFVYFDPPYDPVSQTANFTSYSSDGFSREEQIRLKTTCDDLNARGIRFMLSNSATDFIKEQYKEYNITIVKAKRAINSVGSKRGNVDEVIVRNYE